jgi:hypothetical protein
MGGRMESVTVVISIFREKKSGNFLNGVNFPWY